MKVKKRAPGQIMRIKQVYEGELLDIGNDKTVFRINEEPVPKVRVFGTVIAKQESPESAETPFVYLMIDDGSETIRVKHWKQQFNEDEPDRIFQTLQKVKVGDIIDVLGSVRRYEGERYLITRGINIENDLDWEMHRRAKLLDQDLAEKGGMSQEEVDPLQNQQARSEKGEEEHIDIEVKKDKLLQVMSDDPEQNTVPQLAQKMDMTKEKTKEVLKELYNEGMIIRPRPNLYEKL